MGALKPAHLQTLLELLPLGPEIPCQDVHDRAGKEDMKIATGSLEARADHPMKFSFFMCSEIIYRRITISPIDMKITLVAYPRIQ